MNFSSLKECDLKKILLILCVSLLSSCGTKELSSDQLVERQGIDDEIKFWETRYGNGQLRSKGSYKDGKNDGPWESYYENGQLFSKTYHKDGKKDGTWEYYHENGQLERKTSYKDGKFQDGTLEMYDENGRQTYP
tara:strand:+ start:110 stop:514 length:405 start_codon:yes stop_codon:yes gene_type:complete